jgi:hypothetical protein
MYALENLSIWDSVQDVRHSGIRLTQARLQPCNRATHTRFHKFKSVTHLLGNSTRLQLHSRKHILQPNVRLNCLSCIMHLTKTTQRKFNVLIETYD